MNCLLTDSDKWSFTVFRMLLLSFPLFLLSMTRREMYIFTCLAIDRSSELHGAIRDTIAGSSHYLFSLDKFAARIRHKIHCACNDYAKPPEMQRHGLIVIDLNNDRGCGRRTSALQRHDENGNMKKAPLPLQEPRTITCKPVQIADIPLSSFWFTYRLPNRVESYNSIKIKCIAFPVCMKFQIYHCKEWNFTSSVQF